MDMRVEDFFTMVMDVTMVITFITFILGFLYIAYKTRGKE